MLIAQPERPTVAAKLQPPEGPPDLLTRDRLVSLIQCGAGHAQTLILAPAGSGKTVALSRALSSIPVAVAWISLDEQDDDPRSFLKITVEAVRTRFPDACLSTRTLLDLPDLPSPGLMARTLVADLSDLPEELVLALDDFHVIRHPEAQAIVNALLRMCPAQLHLVISTREPAQLSLSRLRANQQLTEIDFRQLRFTVAEAEHFFAQAIEGVLSLQEVCRIHEQVDGWAAGLRLAAIAIRDGGGKLTSEAAYRLSRNAEDYLYEEVVSRQPEEIRDFLFQSAVPDGFCLPLMDQLAERHKRPESSSAVLSRLEQIGFVSSLDVERDWFHYHQFMRNTLLHHLYQTYPSDWISSLHIRAAGWFERNGDVAQAIRLAIGSGDAVEAARIVERHVEELLDRCDWPALDSWLRLLPAAQVDHRPGLVLAQIHVAYARHFVGRIQRLLDLADRLLSDPPSDLTPEELTGLSAEVALWKSYVCISRGEAQSAAIFGQRAWLGISATHPQALALAGACLGMAYQMQGRRADALALLSDQRAADLDDRPSARSRLLEGVCYAQLSAGAFAEVEALARQVIRDVGPAARQPTTWLNYYLGRVCYERNELERALDHFERVVEQREAAHSSAFRAALQGIALIHQAMGDCQHANRLAKTMLEQAAETSTVEKNNAAMAFRGRLALMQGDVGEARRWLFGCGTEDFQLAYSFELPALAWARLLIAERTSHGLAEAEALLARQLERYEACHDVLRTVDILALQALALQSRGEIEGALIALEHAVSLASQCGIVRILVDQGPSLGPLLLELARRPQYRDFITRVVNSFDAPRLARVADVADHALPLEQLTEREVVVLELMAQRLTNKEIAQNLSVSWLTVSKHASHIFAKLQVSGRRAAVDRARRLGLVRAESVS